MEVKSRQELLQEWRDGLDESNDILAHHGIKGMKWGVRRTPEQLGYKKKEKKQKLTREEKKEIRFKKEEEKLAKREAEVARKQYIVDRKNTLRENKEKLAESKRYKVVVKNPLKKEEPKKPTVDTNKVRDAKTMSNEELQAFISRYNLEKTYRQITGTTDKKGIGKTVKKILSESGQKVAAEFTVKYMKKGVEALEKKLQRRRGGSGGGAGGGGGGTP